MPELPDLQLPNITLLGLLGEGAHGKVYLAENTILQAKVALKVLSKNSADDEKWHVRFLREAQILSRLEHPNIVKVHSYGMTPTADAYFIMDYVEGANLEELLRKKADYFTAEQACLIGAALAEAIQLAHDDGVVHRDIKPSNIIIKSDSNQTPVLLDFGVASLHELGAAQGLTGTAQILGTPAYMSPEQSAGKGASKPSDQYSLCCVLVFMLSGKQLFQGRTDLELMMKHSNEAPDLSSLKISELLRNNLLRGLAKSPDERFPDMLSLASALRQASGSTNAELFKVRIAWGLMAMLTVFSIASLLSAHLHPQEIVPERNVEVWKDYAEGMELHGKSRYSDAAPKLKRFIDSPIALTDKRKLLLALECYLPCCTDKKERVRLAREFFRLTKERSAIDKTWLALKGLVKDEVEEGNFRDAETLLDELEAVAKQTTAETDIFDAYSLESLIYHKLGKSQEAEKADSLIRSYMNGHHLIASRSISAYFKARLIVALQSGVPLEKLRSVEAEYRAWLEHVLLADAAKAVADRGKSPFDRPADAIKAGVEFTVELRDEHLIKEAEAYAGSYLKIMLPSGQLPAGDFLDLLTNWCWGAEQYRTSYDESKAWRPYLLDLLSHAKSVKDFGQINCLYSGLENYCSYLCSISRKNEAVKIYELAYAKISSLPDYGSNYKLAFIRFKTQLLNKPEPPNMSDADLLELSKQLLENFRTQVQEKSLGLYAATSAKEILLQLNLRGMNAGALKLAEEVWQPIYESEDVTVIIKCHLLQQVLIAISAAPQANTFVPSKLQDIQNEYLELYRKGKSNQAFNSDTARKACSDLLVKLVTKFKGKAAAETFIQAQSN